MKTLFVSIAALAMLAIASPAAFAVDSSISPLCRAGAPEAYSRAGGFCEQVASNASLHPGKNPNCKGDDVWNGSECVCPKS